MAMIKLTPFSGMIPRMGNRLLPNEAAQSAAAVVAVKAIPLVQALPVVHQQVTAGTSLATQVTTVITREPVLAGRPMMPTVPRSQGLAATAAPSGQRARQVIPAPACIRLKPAQRAAQPARPLWATPTSHGPLSAHSLEQSHDQRRR